jgi:transposase-like protein
MKKHKPYSKDFKEQALTKIYNRGDRTIQSVADDLNINISTLKHWMSDKTLADKNPLKTKPKRPEDWSAEKRLSALQETYGMESEALNAWCRECGIFSHHLEQWKSDFCKLTPSTENREDVKTLRGLKAENQRLERELNRKEKALAEAAALLVLQKKYRALLGEEVE